jgi:PAS domain S-box-containing protein
MDARFWFVAFTPLLALLSYAILLVVVLRRGLESRLSHFFAFYLFVMAIWSLGSAMMRLQPDYIVFWNKLTTGTAMIMPLAFYGFVQVFLKKTPKIWLWAAIFVLIGLEVTNALGLMMTNVRLLEGGLVAFDVSPIIYLMAALNVGFLVLSFSLLMHAHWRTSDPVLRNRIRYPLIGAVVVLAGGLTNLVGSVAYYPIDHAANFLNAFLLAYAVLRYQLADITLVVRKGLLYSIPTAIIGAAYFFLISLATTLFRASASSQILLLSLAVAAITAVAVQPLRDRAQLWIDRLFFREKYDASLMLQRLSRAVASVLDLDRLTNMILDEITTTMHIKSTAFFLKRVDSREFRLMAQRGLVRDVDVRLIEDHPLVDWLSKHEDALSRYEVDLIPQFKALWGEERKDLERLGAELFVPLKAKGELVGILTVGPKLSQEAYSQDDQRTLTTLANQTATALENARLHEETQRRYRELALLNRIIAASATSQDIEPILNTVCQELALAFGVFQPTAALFNEDRTEALVVTTRGSLLSTSRPQRVPSVKGLAQSHLLPQGRTVPVPHNPLFQYLLKHKSPLILDGTQLDPEVVSIQDLMRRHGTASLLALPLLVEGEVMGCLSLEAYQSYPFSLDEIDLTRRVAEQISGALARARLAQTQKRLSTAVEQAAEAVMITDTGGTILYVNPAFEQITGYDRTEMVGRDPQAFNGGKQDDALYGYLKEAIDTGQVWQGRLVNRKKDGSLYTSDMTISPARNLAGEIVNYVATMRDVTREVQFEQQFYQSQKMEALGRLAGGIAHDFNNLLTVIQLSIRLLQRQMSLEDPLWEHVSRIQETSERAAKLTKQLLSFSRRELIEPQVVTLNQLVSDLGRILQRIIGEDVKLVMTLAEDLWLVKVDPSQMEQVILNLAVNARDAMPEGGILKIETANVILSEAYVARHVDAQPGEHVMLAVGDTGVGMDEEVKAHLFEPFFTTKARGQGTGLGLSTVFGIIRQSEGHIWVQSDLGRGTTFRIYMPRAREAAAIIAPRTVATSAVGGGETILVVEDEEDVRALTIRTLRMQGYKVLAARDGQDALQVSAEYDAPIHLLLTDVVMPQMDGRELARQMQPRRCEMRVLYMSGYADRPFVKQFLSTPGIAFLPKPFTVEALVQKVQAALENNPSG